MSSARGTTVLWLPTGGNLLLLQPQTSNGSQSPGFSAGSPECTNNSCALCCVCVYTGAAHV